jgi:hypothetical protein
MPTLPLASTNKTYLHESRAPRYSLAFALPLLVMYELLAAVLTGDSGVRNGADVLLKSTFVAVAGRRGPLIFAVLLIGIMVWLIVRDRRRAGAPMRASVFSVMLAESAVLAVVFGLVVGILTAQLIGAVSAAPAPSGVDVAGLSMIAPAASNLPQLEKMGFATALMVSLGAGLYEELLFRVILVGALVVGARKLLGWGPVAAGTLGVLGGALVFSAFHYIGPFGDRVELGSFVFRTIAGIAFSGLYVLRGFGITAWTHALYDVFLLFR